MFQPIVTNEKLKDHPLVVEWHCTRCSSLHYELVPYGNWALQFDCGCGGKLSPFPRKDDHVIDPGRDQGMNGDGI